MEIIETPEWTTNLWVEREKSPQRPDRSWLDETEIFEGSENKLVMRQSYTHEFLCTFELRHYPFDAQVIQRHNSSNSRVLRMNLGVLR